MSLSDHIREHAILGITGQGGVALVATSLTLGNEHDGLVLEMTAVATLTIPMNLPIGFAVAVIPNVTTSLAFSGTTGNGAATTINVAAASTKMFAIQQKASNRNAYVVTGV